MNKNKKFNYLQTFLVILGILVFIDISKYILSDASLIYWDMPCVNETGQVNKMLGKILKNWNPPRKYRHKHVIVEFKIDNEGKITNLDIKESSKIKVLDELAVQTIKKAEPFGYFSPEQNMCTFKVKLSTKRYMLVYDFGGIRLIKE